MRSASDLLAVMFLFMVFGALVIYLAADWTERRRKRWEEHVWHEDSMRRADDVSGAADWADTTHDQWVAEDPLDMALYDREALLELLAGMAPHDRALRTSKLYDWAEEE